MMKPWTIISWILSSWGTKMNKARSKKKRRAFVLLVLVVAGAPASPLLDAAAGGEEMSYSLMFVAHDDVPSARA